MNLLDYTKKLSEKIKVYDKLTKNPFASNPLSKPTNITIIWIDEEKN